MSFKHLAIVALTTFISSSGTLAENVSLNCDVDCQATFRAGLAFEADRWVSPDVATDPFYANPANLSEYAAGDLVKWENLSRDQIAGQWTIPAGMSLSRLFYISEDIDGKPLPATAFALVPFSNPLGADKPLRTVVWTHGTAGGTRQCAPSNHKALYYEWEGPLVLAQSGYLVIAPDYAGQGSDIPQGFMYESGALHAADVGFGVQASRKALGNLMSQEWVVIGHSEGGMTAWRTNEREAKPGKATGGLIGAVSGAPALRPLRLIPESFRRADGGPVGDVVSIFFIQSLARLFPELKLGDYVSDIVASRIPLADQGCLYTGGALYSNLTQPELYKNTSWLTHPLVVDWQQRYNGAGPYQLASPMLVVQGIGDTLTYAEFCEDDFDETCTTFPETTAELLLYPDLDHDPSFQAAQAQYLPWIADRFDHVQLEKGCKKTTVSPVTDRFSVKQQVWLAEAKALG